MHAYLMAASVESLDKYFRRPAQKSKARFGAYTSKRAFVLDPAATYSPTQLPAQYHRLWEA